MKLAPSEFFKTSSIEEYAVGERYTDGVGRTFRYGQAGASNLARGKLAVAPTVVANHVNLSFQTAPAIGDSEVKVTLGATAATKDQYKGGMLVVQDGTGEGRAYAIAGHPAADASGTLRLTLKEKIDTAGALAEANVDLISNPWRGGVISVVDQADQPIGIPVVAITASEFGWFQTAGPCSALMDETITTGQAVTTGTGVAGALEALDAAGEPQIGIMMAQAGVDTEYTLVFLTLDSVVE